MKKLILGILFLGLVGCGPTLKNNEISIVLPKDIITAVDSNGKSIPIQINIANKTIELGREANIPVSMIPSVQ